MMQDKMKIFVVCTTALFLLGTGLAQAQTTGTILGTVEDESGAVIPNATIQVENEAIALQRRTQSREDGSYVFPALPVGNYVITAEASGFARFQSSPLELEINQQARVLIVLRVGKREETVIVQASAALVETTSAALGEVIGERQVVDLPLNGRNFLQLATLQPGVTPATVEYTPSSGSRLLDEQAGATSQVNGLRIQSNNYLLDGADNNEPFYGFIAAVPNPDAIEEFKILTNAYSAEFGRGGGGIINVVTKSGTNEIHGTIFEFLRNDVLDARSFFASETPPLKRNQFGVSVGAPIVKDKAFLFGTYEGLRESKGVNVNTNVPSALERVGDFSQSANPPVNPLTGELFPGNVIPATRINLVNQGLLQFYPAATDGQNGFVSARAAPTDGDQFMLKGDVVIGEKDRLTGTYFFSDFSLEDLNPPSFFGVIGVPGFGVGDSTQNHRIILSETHTFGATAINTARFVYHRTVLNSGIPLQERNRSDFGFTFASRIVDDLPIIGVSGFSTFGLTSVANFFRTANTFEGSDDFSLVRGRHNLKFGAQARRLRLVQEALAFESGGYLYAGAFSGNALADYMLGQPGFFLQFSGNLRRYWFTTQTSFYAQDDIRLSPTLTLNLGLRYDVIFPTTEGQDRMMAFRPGQTSTVNPAFPEGLLVVGDPGIPKGTVETDLNNLAPRIGLAWDPFGTGTTSIRAGYGIFYDNVVGFVAFQEVLYPGLTLIQFLFAPPGVADPYAPGVSPFAGTAPLPFTGQQNQYNPLDQDFATPYAQQWNLTIQQEFAENFLFQIGYVGTKGTRLVATHNLNPAEFVPGNTSPFNVPQRRRFIEFENIWNNEQSFRSTYHSLQLSAKRRFTSGFSFLAAYTWAKTIDNNSLLHPFNSARGQQAIAQNPDDLSADKGLAAFDVRHRFVTNFLWDVPLLRQNDWKGRVAGNWAISGIISAQSGTPFTVVDSANPSHNGTGSTSDRTNLVSGCDINRSGGDSVSQFFNTACFQPFLPFSDPSSTGQFGTAGRNILTGPDLFNADFAVYKDIPINETMRFQFRAEFFNIFNHANFAIPDNDIQSPTFGRILNTLRSNERQIQFGLKFYF